MLDVESMSGHLLLRQLSKMPETTDLVHSVTSHEWNAFHLASYFVDFSTIALLVKAFSADVTGRTPQPKSLSALDMVLEAARRFPSDLRGSDSQARWSRLAYRSSLFLQGELEKRGKSYYLTPLHVTTYIGYFPEVVRLVDGNLESVLETNYEGEMPRQMLERTLPKDVETDSAKKFCDTARVVYEYLEGKELEAEEQGEQDWIQAHRAAADVDVE